MNERLIELTDISPNDLFGPRNSNVAIIKKFYPKLKIIARGNKLKAYGEPEILDEFEKKVAQLVSYFKKYNKLDETSIEGVLTWQLQQSFPERLWQHKKLLKEIDQLLQQAKQQRNRFIVLKDSRLLLSDLAERIEKSATGIKTQLTHVTKLREKTSNKIQQNIQQFVDNQRGVLEAHLLTSRHEMAAVLESMAKFDKRIEKQLAPNLQNKETL